MRAPILLTAGGTGGHLFPAEALCAELIRRGETVDLATDERADKYGKAFPARAVHIVPSATFGSKNPIALARSAAHLGAGLLKAHGLIGHLKPSVVVGFGGYPTFPPMLAAQFRSVPTILHEQNAVMGRANRALAARATKIATSFATTEKIGDAQAKAIHTGNPVRDAVRAVASRPFVAPEAGGPIRLLVFGGSQGARYFSDVVPPALARLDPALRARLVLTQQCREEDIARVDEAYRAMGLKAKLARFFVDLPERMANAHLVIGRAGASTVAELGVIGRPSLLVPYAFALDADQAANARVLAGAGGAVVIAQQDLTEDRLAGDLAALLTAPDRLAALSTGAKAAGRPDAVERLADLVQAVAGHR